jgi:hypothetical protein
MSERNEALDPGCVWRDQPAEKLPVNLKPIVDRRTEELSSSTRWEILTSIAAAILLVAIAAWRLENLREGLLELGIAAVVGWVAISLYVFRRRIWKRSELRQDAIARTGVEYYRAELERRRAHLKNEWLWHGPLVLALMMFAFILFGHANIAFRPLRSMWPLIALLVAWIAFGIWRRRIQIQQIQREIDELPPLGARE